jgi:hypothetical protein
MGILASPLMDTVVSRLPASAPRGMQLIIRDDWPLTLLGGDIGPMVPTVLLSLMDTGPAAIPSSIQVIICWQHIKGDNRLALFQQGFSTTTSAFIRNYTCRQFPLLTDKLHNGPNFGTASTECQLRGAPSTSASKWGSGCVWTARGVNLPLSAS